MRFEIDVLAVWAFVAVTAIIGCLAIYYWSKFVHDTRPMSEDEWRERFEPNLPNTNNPVLPDDAAEWVWPTGSHVLEDDGTTVSIYRPKGEPDDAA